MLHRSDILVTTSEFNQNQKLRLRISPRKQIVYMTRDNKTENQSRYSDVGEIMRFFLFFRQ
jgi:hypothetical protein